jgi:hypothetical protein
MMEKHEAEGQEETITIELRKSEALVLDDLLGRWDRAGSEFTLYLEHDAEWHALAAIEGSLETQLVEPFMRDYSERLAAAREKIVERCGTVER